MFRRLRQIQPHHLAEQLGLQPHVNPQDALQPSPLDLEEPAIVAMMRLPTAAGSL